jgi:hypothetical protein
MPPARRTVLTIAISVARVAAVHVAAFVRCLHDANARRCPVPEALQVTVTDMSTNGGAVFARLYSPVNRTWVSTGYTLLAAGTRQLAAITSPTTGSNLGSSGMTLHRDPGKGVTETWLGAGTTYRGSAYLNDAGTPATVRRRR